MAKFFVIYFDSLGVNGLEKFGLENCKHFCV